VPWGGQTLAEAKRGKGKMGVSSAVRGKGRRGSWVLVTAVRGGENGAGRGTDLGVVEASGTPCGNTQGGLVRMGCYGVAGRPLADVGQSGENGKMGPSQEVSFSELLNGFEKNRIDLIRRGPSQL
jgi:hypothetical protein